MKFNKYVIFFFLIFNFKDIKTAAGIDESQKLNEKLLEAVIDNCPLKEIEELITLGADVNYNKEGIDICKNDISNIDEAERFCTPPLTHAIANENEDLITMLIFKGASPYYKDTYGNFPLAAALNRLTNRPLKNFIAYASLYRMSYDVLIVGLYSDLKKNPLFNFITDEYEGIPGNNYEIYFSGLERSTGKMCTSVHDFSSDKPSLTCKKYYPE